MISLPGAVLGTAGSVMTPLLIYANFNAATAGQFGLVERAAGLPLAMIVGVISQVHMGNLAQDIRDKTDLARQSYIRLTVLLATIALPPAILCFIFAPQLFVILFGPGWDQAAQFARLLAPAYFVGLVTGGLNMTLTVMGNQKTQIGWDFSRFCCMVLLWTFAPSAGWTINTIVLFHSILLSAFSLIQFYLCFRVLPRMSSRRSDPLGQ
jgi:O-antigen/teichoic acid export membrane protein